MKIYSDGASSFNGSSKAIGGWAYAIILDEEIIAKNSGKVIGATNQQMELKAVIEGCKDALIEYKNMLYPVSYCGSNSKEFGNSFLSKNFFVYSDSSYVVNCFLQNWWRKWQANGWKNSKKEPVANKELWEELIPYFEHPFFDFCKVKGHSTDTWNEYVDTLAVDARLKKSNKGEEKL